VRFRIPFAHGRPNGYLLAFVCWGALLALSLLVWASQPAYSGPVVVLLAVGAGVAINRHLRARKQRLGAA